MDSTKRLRVLVIGLAGFMAQCCMAGEVEKPVTDIAARSLQYHEHYVVAPDGKTSATYRLIVKALKADALENLRQQRLDVSKSAQTLKILAAYTLKANGRKISVPPSSWQVRKDTGNTGRSPIFSDRHSTTLVFPDLGVDDSVVLSYRIDTIDPYFPGKVSLSESFSKDAAYDDVRITIEAPQGMTATFAARGMQESIENKAGKRKITWTWKNPQPVQTERTNWSVFDVESEPGFMFSTFDGWSDIAKSYAERADRKAKVTPQIQQLSDEIVRGASTERDKARLLYEWVSREIDYAGNCVGIGAVVPRDLDVVLKHRLGDCKDHATLLQALLAAQGIASAQVLVNSGSLYRLPSIPVASMVNHVINWIPSLALFADPTSSTTVFGRLPFSDQQKPVLAASADVPAVTPSDSGGHTQAMRTRLLLKENGDVEGEVHVTVGGRFAESARGRLRQMNKDYVAAFVRESFRRIGLEADGDFRFDDPKQYVDTLAFDARFKARSGYRFPGSGALPLGPWFYNEAPIARFAQQANLPIEPYESTCSSAASVEEYEITLPEAMQILDLPKGTSLKSDLVTYDSTYQLEGRVLRVKRAIDDRSQGNICSAATSQNYQQALKTVMDDLRQQVLYK